MLVGDPVIESARRCYGCDQVQAMYEAHLDHDTTPVVLLCDACAIWERDAGSVEWIRTLVSSKSGSEGEVRGPSCRGLSWQIHPRRTARQCPA